MSKFTHRLRVLVVGIIISTALYTPTVRAGATTEEYLGCLVCKDTSTGVIGHYETCHQVGDGEYGQIRCKEIVTTMFGFCEAGGGACYNIVVVGGGGGGGTYGGTNQRNDTGGCSAEYAWCY